MRDRYTRDSNGEMRPVGAGFDDGIVPGLTSRTDELVRLSREPDEFVCSTRATAQDTIEQR